MGIRPGQAGEPPTTAGTLWFSRVLEWGPLPRGIGTRPTEGTSSMASTKGPGVTEPEQTSTRFKVAP